MSSRPETTRNRGTRYSRPETTEERIARLEKKMALILERLDERFPKSDED